MPYDEISRPGLRDYQVADLTFYMQNPRCMNLSDPGTGKTPSVCVMQYHLWENCNIGTVWVQPKKLLEKNRAELLRFTPFRPEDVVIVDGTPTEVERQLVSGAKVFLTGFRRFALSHKFLPERVKALHIDEFHMGFKGVDSAQTKAMFDFIQKRKAQFLPMTGTLVCGPLDSVYPAIHVIEPRFYSSHAEFMRQHAIRDWNDKIIGWGNHSKLSLILGRYGIRRTFKDIHGDVEIQAVPQVVQMTPAQRGMYEHFKELAFLELEKFLIDGTRPGVNFIRARQIQEHPNHFPDLTEPGQYVDILRGEQAAKEAVLDVHLEDHARSGLPIIIFSPLRPQQTRIEALLRQHGIPYGTINGDTSGKDTARIDEGFRAGTIRALVCSPACASVGFNWQFCGDAEVEHMLFTCLDYLDTTYLQAVQRAVRGPRRTPLRVSILEYEDSMDQRLAYIVWQKSLEAHRVDPTRPVLKLSAYEVNAMD